MNEQNRQRLGRIATRHTRCVAHGQSETESDATFIAEFGRVRDEVLRPVMDEVGLQLQTDGYEFRIANGGTEASPAVEFHVVIPGRTDAKDTIRLFAHKDALRGWQVIAEIELKRSPMELARFDAGDPITRDVAERLIVDATEQVFASALSAPSREAEARATPSESVSPRPPVADVAPAATGPHPAEGAVGARALVLQRLRAGRLLYGLNLVGADLHGIDFTDRMMPALDLREANLSGCTLVGARLVAARLDGADLTDTDLTRADLTRANLIGATLTGARLDGAVLSDTVGLQLAPADAPEPEPEPEPRAVEAPAEHVDVFAVPDKPPPLPPLPAGPEIRWAGWAGEQRMGDTEEVDVRVFQRRALPFAEGPPAPEFFAAADAARTEPRVSRPPGNETVALPVLQVPDEPLTVEQYAAFCAELSVFPDAADSIHRQYGVPGAEARGLLDAAFARRFAADPTLERKCRALVRHYEGWFRREGPR